MCYMSEEITKQMGTPKVHMVLLSFQIEYTLT